MELNFKELGQGPALVILHGLFGSLDNWLTLGRQFAETHTVYLIDQRNHGRSPHADHMDYSAMAADLQEFFSQQGIREATVLGHSMGGKTAMRFALDFPELTEALIVADIAPKTYPSGHDLIFEALCALKPATLRNREQAEEELSLLIDDIGVRLFLLKNLTRSKDGSYQWKMNLPVIERDYANILKGITADFPYMGPVRFIRGALSNYLKDSDWPEIAALFPEADLVDIPGAGHWLHADQPQAFFNAAQEFLKQV
jgi:esterase